MFRSRWGKERIGGGGRRSCRRRGDEILGINSSDAKRYLHVELREGGDKSGAEELKERIRIHGRRRRRERGRREEGREVEDRRVVVVVMTMMAMVG